MFKIKSIVKNDLCIGCGYCAYLSNTEMHYDDNGFLVPDATTDDKNSLKKSAFIKASCPGLNGDSVITEGIAPEGAIDDHMWGRYYRVITAWSTDEKIRHEGSSGGALTALATWLISTGRVDSVLVTGYDPDYPIGTESKVTSKAGKILDAAGSKYCPASPLVALRSIDQSSGKHAVIGRPCDVATLRRAIKAGDPIGNKIEILLSFFCAGTPSDLGNRELLNKLRVTKPGDVESFRHRGKGWPGDTKAVLKDGQVSTCTYNESWGMVLRRHVHTLCKICPDGIGEQADIVAADAWYGDTDGYPTFDEAEGRSLVIARTKLGRDLLNSALEEKVLASEDLDIREIDRMQPGQINRRRQLALRVLAYRIVGQKVPQYNRQALKGYQAEMSFTTKLRVFVASVKRLVKRRIIGQRN